jgi:hypothetical protein
VLIFRRCAASELRAGAAPHLASEGYKAESYSSEDFSDEAPFTLRPPAGVPSASSQLRR